MGPTHPLSSQPEDFIPDKGPFSQAENIFWQLEAYFFHLMLVFEA